ncbi:NADPH-dependent FMN reductase [Albibacterium profundi]|uniref:NAD(P)H-dependent oxidoreductase n=1 Tax=Albibacterium profundi TaxID=3134906 RepID=A0ABV5CH41_9SPHI
MNDKIKILGIAGSVRKESFNRSALKEASKLVPENAEIEIYELDENLPGFNQDKEQNPPASIVEFKKKIKEADAILFVTPEYNYSVPGLLKNYIDWASRPYGDNAFNGKPAAIMGASIGNIASARAQYHLRQMFVFLDITAVNQPEVMIGMAQDKFDNQGNLTDNDTKGFISKLLVNLVKLTKTLKG